MIQVVKRAHSLLLAVRALESAPLRDLASACGLPKTTAGNILRSLAELGLLDQAPNGDYRIGGGLRELANGEGDGAALAEAAARVIPELAARLGETVLAVRLRGHRLEVLAEAAGTRSIVVHPDAIRDIAPTTWATGRVLLAHLPAEDPRRRRGEADNDFPRIRREGVAYRRSPDGEIQSLAVPILHDGKAVAAVGLCLPVFRYAATDRAALVADLRRAAEEMGTET